MWGGCSSSSSPTPAAVMSSANDGSMWPTAKIARAIVGEPPESLRTLTLTSAAESKYTHHSAAASAIAATRTAQSPLVGLPSRDTWPASTTTSPSRMIRKQPEALGEVLRVERLGGVGRPQHRPVAV